VKTTLWIVNSRRRLLLLLLLLLLQRKNPNQQVSCLIASNTVFVLNLLCALTQKESQCTCQMMSNNDEYVKSKF